MHTQTVTVVRPGTSTDRYGNAAPDWDTTESTDITNVNVVPSAGAEVAEDGRTPVLSGWRVITQSGDPIPDVRPTDRITYRGGTYEVIGEPMNWPDPLTGSPDHLEITIKRIAG